MRVVAVAAAERIGDLVADEEVVARAADGVLDDDAVGDREAAVHAVRIGHEAAAADLDLRVASFRLITTSTAAPALIVSTPPASQMQL